MINNVYIGVGSNVVARYNIGRALEEMRLTFGALDQSPVYQSASVGFDGDDFLNLVVKFETSLDVNAVVNQLRMIEDALGRDRTQPRFSKRPIDLDILLYGDMETNRPGIQVPRDEILESAYVLRPLCDLSPHLLHPQQQLSYLDLWLIMAPNAPRLDLVRMD
jgi:2-amino-4-hydroxy-6-hydroxymethyldihydropteridine diphosphokinase|tara:strand:+ start:1186 stop:1674 length:489 start_codon:yes stop_codon:yes gene_type:complete